MRSTFGLIHAECCHTKQDGPAEPGRVEGGRQRIEHLDVDSGRGVAGAIHRAPRGRDRPGGPHHQVVAYLVARDDSSEAFGAESALEIAEAHFAAFNGGDSAGAIAFFADDVTFWNNFGGSSETDFSIQRLEWNVAQGTIKSPLECAIAEETPGGPFRVKRSFPA